VPWQIRNRPIRSDVMDDGEKCIVKMVRRMVQTGRDKDWLVVRVR